MAESAIHDVDTTTGTCLSQVAASTTIAVDRRWIPSITEALLLMVLGRAVHRPSIKECHLPRTGRQVSPDLRFDILGGERYNPFEIGPCGLTDLPTRAGKPASVAEGHCRTKDKKQKQGRRGAKGSGQKPPLHL